MIADIKSHEQFKDIINSNKPTLIDFWATWCGPCKMISPVFAKLAEEYPDLQFYKVDVDEQDKIAEEVGIHAMPTFMAFKEGKRLDTIVGAVPSRLQELITKAAQAA